VRGRAAEALCLRAIGFELALAMLYLMVVNPLAGPFTSIVCGACLVWLFFETAFGICLGCKLYNLFHKEPAQGAVVVAFVSLVGATAYGVAAKQLLAMRRANSPEVRRVRLAGPGGYRGARGLRAVSRRCASTRRPTR
jgi:Domain of unknown function (DUF4395)